VDDAEFLLWYPEPHKVSTNPRWCPYAKGSPREGQAPRSSNSVESHGPSPRTSGAPLLAHLGCSPPSPLSSFRPKRRGSRSLRYTVAAVTQTRLSLSRKTLAPLGTITMAHTRAERFCMFFLNLVNHFTLELFRPLVPDKTNVTNRVWLSSRGWPHNPVCML
jgi:hypothetical protein